MTGLLEQYGQGGSAELKGNSHFDSCFLMADSEEAYILETAGRRWAVKKVEQVASISNMLGIRADWDALLGRDCLAEDRLGRQLTACPKCPPLWAPRYARPSPMTACRSARGTSPSRASSRPCATTAPATTPPRAEAHRNICIHAGPQENRWWQADGVMVTDVGAHGVLAWVTGTSGNCVSIFKPVFLGMDLPDLGPYPTEHFDPRSLWWKHELLHRRAMADFDTLVPEIRQDFDRLEDAFLAQAETVKHGTPGEKAEFMQYCFRRGAGGHRGLDRPAAEAPRPELQRPGLPGHVGQAQCRGRADRPAGRDLIFLEVDMTVTISRDNVFFAFSPQLKAIARIEQGEEVLLETHDCFEGQIQTTSDLVDCAGLDPCQPRHRPAVHRGRQTGRRAAHRPAGHPGR